MPLGLLLDLVECHWQHEDPKRQPHSVSIDDVIPPGI